MLFKGRNFELTKDREKTYLTATTAVADTTLTIRAVDSNAWADDDYIVVGEIGTRNAEIMRISAAVSDGTSLTITQSASGADSGGLRYTHSVNEPVYRIDYNRIEFSRATTEAGTKSVLATNEIQVDNLFTRYEDTANTTGFGFIRFNNQLTGAFSTYSDGIPYTGYTPKSLGRMQRSVRRLLNEPSLDTVTDDDIIEEINEKQRDVAHERLWPFYEDTFSDSTVAYQKAYTIDTDVSFGKVHTITVYSQPLAKIDTVRFDILQWDTATTGDPTHGRVWNGDIEVYPTPSTAAQTTTLNGALTASAVSITVASTSGFSPSGRIIVDSEIMSYTTTSSTQFLGVKRGLEESTAASHLTLATVTDRDIIYSANREPNELADVGDETLIPDPQVLVYGTSMELALSKLNDQALHDRLKIKYDESLTKLRGKFGRKMTSAFFRIKDKEEVISDMGQFRDPNQFPTLS